MNLLYLMFGVIVGLSLGLTGGGGAMFAVPLLVYGAGISGRDAVAISLAAVGTTSFVGFLHRWRLGEVEIRTGLLFAVAGMLGAPLGCWLSNRLPETLLFIAFSGLMLIVAVRMWQQASQPSRPITDCPLPVDKNSPTCQRDATGVLVLTSRCALLLLVVGVFTGVLSGLFGVGGGFVIVPALVLFSGMTMFRAVGTSLMVVTLVSVSGVTAQLAAGRTIPLSVTVWFVLGGIGGLLAGQRIGRRLPVAVLQRVFVVAIVAVAVFVVVRTLFS